MFMVFATNTSAEPKRQDRDKQRATDLLAHLLPRAVCVSQAFRLFVHQGLIIRERPNRPSPAHGRVRRLGSHFMPFVQTIAIRHSVAVLYCAFFFHSINIQSYVHNDTRSYL